MACDVTTLAHKSWNDSEKGGTLESKSLFSHAQSTEGFCCLWNFVRKQLERAEAQGFDIDCDAKEHGRVDRACSKQ